MSLDINFEGLLQKRIRTGELTRSGYECFEDVMVYFDERDIASEDDVSGTDLNTINEDICRYIWNGVD